jgi:hypothetical protein
MVVDIARHLSQFLGGSGRAGAALIDRRLSAAMHGAARGEHIAPGRACFNIEERPVRKP